MVRLLTTIALALGLAACALTAPEKKAPLMASTASAPAAAPSAKKKDIDDSLVCTYERATGSNIPEKVCRRRTSDEERQRTQDMMRQLQSAQMRKD
jgi:hypothetical protein